MEGAPEVGTIRRRDNAGIRSKLYASYKDMTKLDVLVINQLNAQILVL